MTNFSATIDKSYVTAVATGTTVVPAKAIVGIGYSFIAGYIIAAFF
jgi:hypothetical protein